MVRTVLSLALLVVLWGIPPGVAQGAWLRAESTDFVLVGDLPAEQIEALSVSLARFLALLRTIDSDPTAYRPALRVVAFGSAEEFAAYRPDRLRTRHGEGRISGFFVSGRLEDQIVLDARAETDPGNTLYHEALHVFLRHQIPQAPLWLNEGLAEYYSTFSIRYDPEAGRDIGLLGLPKSAHLRLLDREPLLPVARLLEVENDSPVYRDGRKTGIFYAESWALVHYLMSDEGRRTQTMRFLELLGERREPELAFREAFARSPIELEGELARYLRGRTFAHSRVELPDTAELGIVLAPLADAQREVLLGDVLLALQRTDEASERYERALALDGELAAAQRGIGRVLLQRGSTELAITWLEEAVRHAPATSPAERYLLGHALVRQAAETLSGAADQRRVTPLVSELLARARRPLRAALRLDPQLAPAHAELGRSWLLAGGLGRLAEADANEGLRALQRAATLEPDRGELVRDLAILLCRAERCRQAERAISDVLSLYNDPQLVREARIGAARAELRSAAELAGGPRPEAAIERVEALLANAGAEVYTALQPDADQVLEIARHNLLVHRYNRALELARSGQVAAAEAELAPVLREARDAELLRSARQLERALRRAP